MQATIQRVCMQAEASSAAQKRAEADAAAAAKAHEAAIAAEKEHYSGLLQRARASQVHQSHEGDAFKLTLGPRLHVWALQQAAGHLAQFFLSTAAEGH